MLRFRSEVLLHDIAEVTPTCVHMLLWHIRATRLHEPFLLAPPSG